MCEGKHEHRGHKEHRGWGPPDDGRRNFQSAQTFRRGRAIAFLERLHVKRDTLLQQLNQPEFASIQQVISGELKATEAVIQEFIQAFELREVLAEQENTTEGGDKKHDDH
ncbi:hypothetical protein [Paenibacillus sp. MMS20-IR301]|uniref:hypothetical protein n=1 Tax=Paenibacillus sp. MMS20-IR301 TaxID=2895946 RepID=UPI0028EF1779|nr:hypothetical protein [Paenibacillus sp. MMS20-IR301]WNS45339.1 hypothetical protein LOS79_08725 [Paenibacillus sp. MMS20-IR301]